MPPLILTLKLSEWKYNGSTTFGKRHNIYELKNKLYSLFVDQYDPSLNTKLKGAKVYDKSHNAQYSIKLLDVIKSVVCGMEEYMKGTWAMMKSDKLIYIFLHIRNTKNDDYMK